MEKKDLSELHWIASHDGEEFGYDDVDAVNIYKDEEGRELLIDGETNEVLQELSDEDNGPDIFIIE